MEELTEEQKESFYDYYVREIEPNVVKYEFQRDRANRIFHISVFIMAVIIIAGIILFIINKNNISNRYIGDYISIFIIFCAIPIGIVYSIVVDPVMKRIKKEVTPKLLKYLDIKKLNNPIAKEPFVSNYLRSLGLYPKSRFITVEQYYTKKYKDTKINIVEIKLEDIGYRNRTTVFYGVLIFFTNPKQQEAELIIKKNKSVIGKVMEFSKLPLVKIDNEEFEKLYDVYTSNSQSAMKILNNKFIEKLLKINKSKDFSDITLSFEKNNVNIMLGLNYHIFVFSSDEKTYNYKQYEKIVSNFQKIIKVVDDLELI